jgi:hypothetical protein
MQVVARLAYSDGLPRAVIALHRLVVVPRAMIAGHARVGLSKRLGDIAEVAALDEAIQIFLFESTRDRDGCRAAKGIGITKETGHGPRRVVVRRRQ